MSQPRTWLVFANENICRHSDALKELGFINWTTKSKFAEGDTVFLFMSDDRAIRYELRVDKVNVAREDKKYWIAPTTQELTYRLSLVKKYEGHMLNEDILTKVGFNGGRSIQKPIYKNPQLFEYINDVFKIASQSIVLPSHYIVIDLGSGSYCNNNTGHEIFNLEPNEIDGRFYGYAPPHDTINIKQLGASSTDDFIDNVMVIYVMKLPNSNNRKIVAFTDKAKVYAKKQSGQHLNRYIIKNGKQTECTYTIESDYIYNLQSESYPFIFEVADDDLQMFRHQRFYTGRRPKQEAKMLLWLINYLKRQNASEAYDLDFQTKIQEADDSSIGWVDMSKQQPSYNNGKTGKTIAKKASVSKQALRNANFKCTFDENHKTFMTNKGIPYMEGHHLIPCTTSNTEYFWSKYGRNIDCVENIISLCPTCHRRIHFGNQEEKDTIIKTLYEKQIRLLKSIGINISIEELLDLYQD